MVACQFVLLNVLFIKWIELDLYRVITVITLHIKLNIGTCELKLNDKVVLSLAPVVSGSCYILCPQQLPV